MHVRVPPLLLGALALARLPGGGGDGDIVITRPPYLASAINNSVEERTELKTADVALMLFSPPLCNAGVATRPDMTPRVVSASRLLFSCRTAEVRLPEVLHLRHLDCFFSASTLYDSWR